MTADMPAASIATHHDAPESLTALSLDAAIELERLIHDQPANEEVVSRFLTALASATGFNPQTQSVLALAEPMAIEIYNRAIRAKTLDEFGEKLARFAPSVASQYHSRSKSDLSELRSFCLAIHRELVARSYTSFSRMKKPHGRPRRKIGSN